jgi:outer membrane lipoprotein SlyB
MRKSIAIFVMMILVVGVLPLTMPTTAEAQTYVQRYRDRYGRIRYRRVAKPSYYRRHRNRINVAAGTGAGAILGALIGGRKGALIGAGVGAGSSALYTYKLKPKKRKYKKIRRY